MPKILTLRITLKDMRPSIWRKIEIDDSMNFEDLHYVIQALMGWEDDHLYCFNIGKNTTIDGDRVERGSFFPFFGKRREYLKACSAVLASFIKKEGDKFLYTYDFGDNWEVELIVKSISPKKKGQKRAVCLSGKRSGPPEDCGGIFMYSDATEVLKDKNHPHYQELSEWYGEDFDPEYFNIEQVNKRLENY